MVDTDILKQIWKNRVKKIDFVLKWLSRAGSEVGPTKGKKKEGRERRTSRVRERERTEGVRDWSEKDDERRWR
ncbi:hypothetical protein TNCV_350461 [Trichonephila clavipes]|nr:hypothetical protein TNCV_350461 [Trichonephila clavipes]